MIYILYCIIYTVYIYTGIYKPMYHYFMMDCFFLVRFGNAIFSPIWNRNHIANITIQFKENIGTGGRGGYYDEFGVLRYILTHVKLKYCL